MEELLVAGQGWQDGLEAREPKHKGQATVVGIHRLELGTESKQMAEKLERVAGMFFSDFMGQALRDRTRKTYILEYLSLKEFDRP